MKKSNVRVARWLSIAMIGALVTGCGTKHVDSAPTEENMDEQLTTADTVLMNAVVYTMDAKDTIASAVAISGDELIFVGTNEDVKMYIGEETTVMDMEDQMVAPGFISGHDHMAGQELKDITMLTLISENASLEGYVEQLKTYISEHPEKDIIIAGNMDLQLFPNNKINNTWLNEAFPDVPILISDVSDHGRLLNNAAMEYADISNDYIAPDGGTAYRDDNNMLTGYFSDCKDISEIVFSSTIPTEEEYITAFEAYQKDANSYGMTGLNDGGAESITNTLELWERMDSYSKTGNMSMRLNIPIMSAVDYTAAHAEDVVEELDEGQKYNSNYLHVSQVKTYIDGVPEGKTALLLKPYEPAANEAADYCGPKYWDQEELNEFVAKVDEAGYQVLVHAMGDGGCHSGIEAFTYAMDKNSSTDARHVVVHATLMDPADIEKAGKYGLYIATQPVWFYIDPQFGAQEKMMFGEERFMREYVIRDMADAGLTMTGGADYAITPDYRPLTGIECGVTQGAPYEDMQRNPQYVRNEDQTLSAYDMLKVYTINAAKQARMEDIIGSLEVGKKADLVVLEKDITKIDPVDISETEVIYTFFGGKIVYEGK